AGETFLRRGQTLGAFQQTHLTMFWRHHAPKKGEMIAKRKDRFRFRNAGIRSQGLLEQRLRHRRHIFMRKARVSHCKQGVAGLNGFDADLARGNERMSRDDLLDYRHRARSGFDERWRYLS